LKNDIPYYIYYFFIILHKSIRNKVGRILAIDYGRKRTGLAVTDELKLIANSLGTIHSKNVIDYLDIYVSREDVEAFVVGEPRQMNNKESESAKFIEPFVKLLKKKFPSIPVKRFDERFTSKMAFQSMIDAGISKKQRRDKSLIDSISATLILQTYLESLSFNKR
jgi:putative holliday junction resolvase